MSTDTTPFAFSARARRTHEQPISYLMAQAVNNPDLISLAAGLVDYETLPSTEVAELATRILNEPEASAKTRTPKIPLQYGTTEGLAELRQQLLDHVAALDGVAPSSLGDVTDVVVTTGSQQLLFLLTDVLVDPGDIVVTSWPSYFVYTDALKTLGAEVRCVDMDDDGMIPEALERLLESLTQSGDIDRVKIVYVVDYHQNPTGITLSADRRPQLLDLVRRYSRSHRILLVEDSAYRELTYDGEGPKSIRRLDGGRDHVALCHTFSKTFSPGLKTGFGILPADLTEPVLLQKGSHDFGSTNLAQHIISKAMRTGLYQGHVESLCRSYAQKRDVTLGALAASLDGASDDLRWTQPSGGMYVWLTLPESIDTGFEAPLFKKCLETGVIYVPGACCYADDATRTPPRNTIRLSYGAATEEQIEKGIELLAAAVRKVLGTLPVR